MKPEEAKPRDLDDLFEEGWKFKVGRIDGAGWFTAKETAEIAKAYGHASYIFTEALLRYKRIRRDLRNADHYYYLADKAYKQIKGYENLFEEWSK